MPRGQGRGPRGGRRARGASVPGRTICAARLPRLPRRKPPRAILVSRRGTDTRDKKRILTAEILNRGVADARSPRVLPGSAWSRDPHVFEEMLPGRPVGPTCPGGLCPGRPRAVHRRDHFLGIDEHDAGNCPTTGVSREKGRWRGHERSARMPGPGWPSAPPQLAGRRRWRRAASPCGSWQSQTVANTPFFTFG